ncbi:hypothetical protein PPL_11637 [Heterostelium album PN500]|uniref:Uncharacterized protein n=1 Tax=Heterostelium pallidum (strain ATCC 26659 / Pp 5 / PN500) TaxID=670386 RepID=D3BVB1_HETP5|nr:hypothetical protein PPL_11637 [Heterostelium album PN500]EFA74668.1 hypothetical protein PPL_11637 [Heterostelium album PN500]|eukprot:XP_020426802.1 hypothetical protein PPL_11637 [Heterostelium album PN500]
MNLGEDMYRLMYQCNGMSGLTLFKNYEDTQELSSIIGVTPQRISQMSREERLMEAINEIQNDTGFTQKELSQKYGPRGRYLTEAEELEMIKMVEESNTKNIPITKENILNWVVGKLRKVKFQDEAILKADKEADIQGFIKSVHKVIVEN